MPFVDIATHNARLALAPNPDAWVWDENHGPGGPPGWDANLYWPWVDCKMLLSFVSPRMRNSAERAVVLMYQDNPPLVNPMGYRPANLHGILSYCCGPCKSTGCPVGERLAGICSHAATVMYAGCVLPHHPAMFQTTHRNVQLIDRRNPFMMDVEILSEVS